MTAELPLGRALRERPPYPFAHLDALREAAEARGVDVIDVSLGDPREITPEPIRRALIDALGAASCYPRSLGLPELRRAVTAWVGRRFGVTLDPDRHVLPSNGSKEVLFTLPLAVVDRETRPLVLGPDPAYPVYRLGVEAAGGTYVPLPLRAGNGFLPDLGAIDAATWKRASILWINYPNNPTGAVAPLSFFEEAAALCREHGVLLASDEAYTEIWYEEPPAGAIQCGTENVVILHTLSKRSAMPGYRSGFLAGDERLMDALKKFRPGTGTATPEFIQRAAVAAWSDETHVDRIRARFRERRDAVVSRLRAAGYDVSPAPASIYVWARVPGGHTADGFIEHVLERAGVVLTPGTAMGEAGEGWFRISLVHSPERLAEAVDRIAGLGPRS